MSLYKQYKTDPKIEKEGVILQYGNGTSIRVARAGGANTEYLKLLEQRLKPHRRQIQNDAMDPVLLERLIKEVFATSVVIGWEGVDLEETENGPAVPQAPFTKENCIRLFDDLPALFADIQEQSQNIALFRAEIRSADAKN